MAGQGTVGLELAGELDDLDVVVVPVGGGGLIAGVATAVKALQPGARVVGVEPEAGDDVARSLRAGERVAVAVPQTIADGQQVHDPGRAPVGGHPRAGRRGRHRHRRRDRRRHAAALRAREGRGRAQRGDRARRRAGRPASRCAAGRWAWSSAAATSTPRASPPSSRLDRTSAERDIGGRLPWPAMLPSLRLSAAALAAVVVLAAPAGAQADAPRRWPRRRHEGARPAAPLTSPPAGRARSSCASRARPRWSTAAAPSPRTAGASTDRRRRRTRRPCSSARPRAWPPASGSGRSATLLTAPRARCGASRRRVGPAPTTPAAPASRRSARAVAGRRAAQARAQPDPVAASAPATTRCSSSRSARARPRSRAAASSRSCATARGAGAWMPRGPVKRIPRLGDAHNDVGFAARLVSPGALGTTTVLRQNYVRVQACARPAAVARCARRRARASSSATSPCCPTSRGRRGPRTRAARSTTSRP